MNFGFVQVQPVAEHHGKTTLLLPKTLTFVEVFIGIILITMWAFYEVVHNNEVWLNLVALPPL